MLPPEWAGDAIAAGVIAAYYLGRPVAWVLYVVEDIIRALLPSATPTK